MILEFNNVVKGKILDITECSDEIFSEKILGDGVMIAPSDNIISAPCDAEIKTVASSKHAITLVTEDGLPFIIHVGIDTVELNGEGFKSFVKNGDLVLAGQPLLEVDFKLIESRGYDPSVLIIILEKNVNIQKVNNNLETDEFIPVMNIAVLGG